MEIPQLALHEPLYSPGIPSERIFVSNQNVEVSYGDFRATVDRLVSLLQQRGVARGDRVAIALPKSIEYVQTIFATLAAGAIYVPIDTGNPDGKQIKVARAAEPSLIVALAGINVFDGIAPVFHVRVEKDGSGLSSTLPPSSEKTSRPAPAPDDVAAILFTSGSTGNPKGVQLTHKNIMSFVVWSVLTLGIDHNDRLISVAPFHFDLSTLDLFATAYAGASVHIMDEKAVKFPPMIALAMAQRQITICYAAPTLLRMLCSHGRLHKVDLSALRLVLFAGEVFPIAPLRTLMAALPHAEYYNLYGPTETNVCTYYRLPGILSADAISIPIGRACEHVEVFIVGEDGDSVNTGQSGEICVRGHAVSPGYFNMGELTEATRVDSLDSYRTGDLGWIDSDGFVHYQGRRDSQVKIRGHRIELSEIEAVLGSHPGVAEAFVKLDEGSEHDYRLIAYVVRDNGEIGVEELLSHCQRYLTPVAVPNLVEFWSDFPHTSTGKIDRQQLLAAAEKA